MPESDFQNGQQSTSMGFILDMIGKPHSSTKISPFAECCVLATLFGRCVAHARLTKSFPSADSNADSRDFWMRHEWLDGAAAASLDTIPSESLLQSCDPMMWFNRLVADSIPICLSNTAEGNPRATPESHLKIMTYKERAYDSAAKIVLLIKRAPRIGVFKVLISSLIYLHYLYKNGLTRSDADAPSPTKSTILSREISPEHRT